MSEGEGKPFAGVHSEAKAKQQTAAALEFGEEAAKKQDRERKELQHLRNTERELRAKLKDTQTEALKWSELHRDEAKRRTEVEVRLEVERDNAAKQIAALHSTIGLLSRELQEIREQWGQLQQELGEGA